MKKLYSVVAVLLCLSMLSGCYGGIFNRKVRTAGSMETKNFDMEDFSGITIKGQFKRVNLELEQGDYLVEIDADSRYFNELEVSTRGDNLRVSLDDGRHLTEPITLRVRAPEISSLDIQGATKLVSESMLQGDELTINVEGAADTDLELDYAKLHMRVSGATEATLYGTADDFQLTCEGAANVDAKQLITKKADVYIAGAADVTIHCEDELDAKIDGAGEISYYGDPEVRRDVAGIGSIEQAD